MIVNKPIRIETLRSSSQDVAEWIEKFEPQTVKWDNEDSASQGVSFFEEKAFEKSKIMTDEKSGYELLEKAKKVEKCTDGKEKSVLAINDTINAISNGKHQKVFENISKKPLCQFYDGKSNRNYPSRQNNNQTNSNRIVTFSPDSYSRSKRNLTPERSESQA
ncbi:unnamed protein product [Brachionus calyciflorus]|uniref:Uncharacterized protein n=1 Tax=Brachionus calyciflorus TaxID=104777 RepID=A0A814L4H6_9BILA|nr:unnamed protein product [Brachionus calyciflorus]